MREKVRKDAKHCVFSMICSSGGSKSRLAKAAGAEPAGQMRGDKLHAFVARSTFQSQGCQKLTGSEHFWKLRCRKSARRCGTKHISMSKCTKTFRCRFAWQAQGIVHLVGSFKKDGRRRTYAEDLARCISRGRRKTRDMFIRAVSRSER